MNWKVLEQQTRYCTGKKTSTNFFSYQLKLNQLTNTKKTDHTLTNIMVKRAYFITVEDISKSVWTYLSTCELHILQEHSFRGGRIGNYQQTILLPTTLKVMLTDINFEQLTKFTGSRLLIQTQCGH